MWHRIGIMDSPCKFVIKPPGFISHRVVSFERETTEFRFLNHFDAPKKTLA